MSFPRYPKYKDSGVEWLGNVPEHWGVGQSRRLFALRNERVLDSDKQLTASQEHGVIYQEDFIRIAGRRVVEVIKGADILKHVEPNDFVISMRSFQGGIEWCNLCGCISSAYVMLAPCERIHGPFFAYVLKSRSYIQALQATSNLVRDGQALRYDNFTKVDLPLVPMNEQTRIATFLDRETAKIDELVAEQRRLMELLKEKRQAVISYAVTQGLNPHAAMKPSGIEWLGEVPEHWEVKRLKYNMRLLTDKTDRREHPVALENIEGWTGRFIPTETEFEGEGIAFAAGDILFGKLRPYLAKAYRAESSGEAVGDFHVMRPVSGIDSRFAQYQILNREFIAIVDGSTFGSKMPRASWEFVGSMKVTTPLPEEQTQIVAYLNAESAKLDTLTAETQRAIALLQERRTALISAAVTGQIDVRKTA